MPQSRRDLAPMRGTVDTAGGGDANTALRAAARYFDETVTVTRDGDFDDGSGRAYEQTHGALTAEQKTLLGQTSGKIEGQLARFTGDKRGDPAGPMSDDSGDYGAIGTFGSARRGGAAGPAQFREATTEGSGTPESPTGVQGAPEVPETGHTASGYPHVVAGIDGPRVDQPGGERTPNQPAGAALSGVADAEDTEDEDDGLPAGTLDTVKAAKDYIEAADDSDERKARAQAVLDAETSPGGKERETLKDYCEDVLAE